MNYKISENDVWKLMESDLVNYAFNKVTGLSAVWGRTKEEDPEWSPYGPLIADIEITTICKGPGGIPCPFCYKSNTTSGTYMSFETFKIIFDKLPKTLQQIAFGVDAQCESNPDVWKIMQYCRDNGVIPNVTVADITDETADKLVSLCGAVAVSRYSDKNICYDTVKKLTDRGLKQVNIHQMISVETYAQAIDTITDYRNDTRLEKMNAIVFLSLKKKGRGTGFNQLDNDRFRILANACLARKIPFGFDSCSAVKFLKAIEGHEDYEQLEMMTEPCESARFSAYIDVNGMYVPCSFCENQLEGWGSGISVVECDDFVNDIWYNDKNTDFKDVSLACLGNGISCQVYDI